MEEYKNYGNLAVQLNQLGRLKVPLHMINMMNFLPEVRS